MAKSNLNDLLLQADARNGLPKGTMAAVMQQEVGGNKKYLDDPTKYHYDLNKDGKRIAGHTGKISTAFGPFGILESTAAKPGYGVAPLKDKSIEEQVRFASDYLAARSKASGGLEAGLAGYGEGGKYGKQVVGRIGNQGNNNNSGLVAQKMTSSQPQQGGQNALPIPAQGNVPSEAVMASNEVLPQSIEPVINTEANNSPYDYTASNPWVEFLQSLPKDVKPEDIDYMNRNKQILAQAVPEMTGTVPIANRNIDFSTFKGWL